MARVVLDHLGEESFDGPEVGGCVNIHCLLHEVVGAVKDRLTGDDAGIVDEDIDLADLLRGAVDELAVSDINLVGVALAAESNDFILHLIEAVLVDVPKNELGAKAGELEGHEAADAAAAASDEDNIALDGSGAVLEVEIDAPANVSPESEN